MYLNKWHLSTGQQANVMKNKLLICVWLSIWLKPHTCSIVLLYIGVFVILLSCNKNHQATKCR